MEIIALMVLPQMSKMYYRGFQGTVLGPLLVLIYINDIEQHLTLKIRLFADDSSIYRNIICLNDAKLLQNYIFRLHEWAATLQMKFNTNSKKCKIL